jgi:hypothetical protein
LLRALNELLNTKSAQILRRTTTLSRSVPVKTRPTARNPTRSAIRKTGLRCRSVPGTIDWWKVVDGRTVVGGRIVVEGRTVVGGRVVVDERTVVGGRIVVGGKITCRR